MDAAARHAIPAVDRPATGDHVCSLLEGGEVAFVRRAQRYGFQVRSV
jgi:hypothetical protein